MKVLAKPKSVKENSTINEKMTKNKAFCKIELIKKKVSWNGGYIAGGVNIEVRLKMKKTES